MYTKDPNQTADNMIRMISAVVDERFKHLNFDTTEKGTVIQVLVFGFGQKADKMRYKVQVGNIVYSCKSETEFFKEGDQVYIHLPSGDKERELKRIIGKVSVDENQDRVDLSQAGAEAVEYLTQEYSSSSTSNLIIGENFLTEISFGEQLADLALYCQHGINGLEIKASFLNNFTFLEGKKSTTFSYGVRLDVKCMESNEQEKEFIIEFDSSEMLGTVYSLIKPLEQKKIISFANYGINPFSITEIKASLYVKGVIFETGSLTLQELKLRGINIEQTDEPSRIFMQVEDNSITATKVMSLGAALQVDGYQWQVQRFSQGGESRFIDLNGQESKTLLIDQENLVSRVTIFNCQALRKGKIIKQQQVVYVKPDGWYELELRKWSASYLRPRIKKKGSQDYEILDNNWIIEWYFNGVKRDVPYMALDLSSLIQDEKGEPVDLTNLYCVATKITGVSWPATLEAQYIEKPSQIVKEEYSIGNAGETPTEWVDELPSSVPGGKVLYQRILYSDGHEATTYSQQGFSPMVEINKENDTVTLKITDAEKTSTATIKDGKEIDEQTLETRIVTHYASSTNSYTPPLASVEGSEERPSAPWVWKKIREDYRWHITYTNDTSIETEWTNGTWSNWELDVENADDVKAFNTLTNNGEFEGHFYGVYIWTNDADHYFYDPGNGYTKKLIQPLAIDIANNALFLSTGSSVDRVDPPADLTTGKVQGKDEKTLKDYIDYYVNASMIQTGSLLVGTDKKPLLMAGFDNNTVKVAGFNVSDHSLENDTNGYVYLGTDAIKLGTAINNKHPFEVNDQGEMYSISGSIGGWTVNADKIEAQGSMINSEKVQSIIYAFAQATSNDDDNYYNKIYQPNLIGLRSGTPIFVQRTFQYSSMNLITYSTMVIDSIVSDASAQIQDYRIAYSYSQMSVLPTSLSELKDFQSNFTNTWSTLVECIPVEWKSSSDSGFNFLRPIDSSALFYSSIEPLLSNLTSKKNIAGNFKFGLNSNSALKYSSLINLNNSSQIMFYGGGVDANENNSFKVLEDGSVFCSALQTDTIVFSNTKLEFSTAQVYSGSEDTGYYYGIALKTPNQSLSNSDNRGFYIGYDGANFSSLYLKGKKILIKNDGTLYVT